MSSHPSNEATWTAATWRPFTSKHNDSFLVNQDAPEKSGQRIYLQFTWGIFSIICQSLKWTILGGNHIGWFFLRISFSLDNTTSPTSQVCGWIQPEIWKWNLPSWRHKACLRHAKCGAMRLTSSGIFCFAFRNMFLCSLDHVYNVVWIYTLDSVQCLYCRWCILYSRLYTV